MLQKERQQFNDGVCVIYSVENRGKPGGMRKEVLVKKMGPLRYEEKTVGANRFYTAMRSEQRIDMLIRVPRSAEISVIDVCVPIDGEQYRVRQVQRVEGVSPPTDALALERLGAGYDFS